MSKDIIELEQEKLINILKYYTKLLPDNRSGQNTQYKISDAALSAFAVFFMQSPSFLAHQRQMDDAKGQNNVASLFQAKKIPSDNQIRNLLDAVPPDSFSPVFDILISELENQKLLTPFRSINDTLLVALDGTQFFSSNDISCNQCQKTHHTNGSIKYSHSAITPALVAPGLPYAISLPPEFIHNRDGDNKQDCEINAAKRWLETQGRKYSALGITLLGDNLYSRNPYIISLKSKGFSYVLTCKPTSHKYLYRYLDELENTGRIETLSVDVQKGKRKYNYQYRFFNALPLNGENDAVQVNWCELRIFDNTGKQTFVNCYVTDHAITKENCAEIINAGRTRWKIENENNNTLKTKGYNLEHNFGHGKKHLSETLLTLNLLAFLFHTILHISDHKYKAIRDKLGARVTFFQHIRTLTYYSYFKNWDHLIDFMFVGLEIELPLPVDTS